MTRRPPDPPPRLCWWCAASQHIRCNGTASKTLRDGVYTEQPCECDCRDGLLW